MEKHKVKTRVAGDKARKKIIAAAQRLFVAKGLAGTSMGDISTKAGVTKSLIYHHFNDKLSLWKMVKQSIFNTVVVDEALPLDKGLRAYLEALFLQRYHTYRNSPDIARMIAWQNLEDADIELCGIDQHSPGQWLQQL